MSSHGTPTRNSRSLRAGVRSFMTVFNGARECAAAVEAGRKPSASAIKALGLDPHSFDSYNRF